MDLAGMRDPLRREHPNAGGNRYGSSTKPGVCSYRYGSDNVLYLGVDLGTANSAVASIFYNIRTMKGMGSRRIPCHKIAQAYQAEAQMKIGDFIAVL